MAETRNTPQDDFRASVHTVVSTDVVGYLNISVVATDYSITLPDGRFQCILDAASDVAIGLAAATSAALVHAAAPVAGVIVPPGLGPVIAGGQVWHFRMTNTTGKLYFQQVG
jgi:hypothetical protein